MKTAFSISLLALMSLSCASASAQPPASSALPADADVDQILDALHARGQNLRDFDADVKLTETDESTQDSFSRMGKVFYQSKGGGDARIRVTFDAKMVGDLSRPNEKVEYLLDNGWLIERDYRKRIEINRQVLRPGEKFNLLKLGEGPFPLPIGQAREDVQRMFDVTPIAASPDGPANTIHVRLTPRENSQFARKLSWLEVWIDRDTKMPVRIDALDVNETTMRTTELSNVRVNAGSPQDAFALPKIDEKQWTRHDEPFEG